MSKNSLHHLLSPDIKQASEEIITAFRNNESNRQKYWEKKKADLIKLAKSRKKTGLR